MNLDLELEAWRREWRAETAPLLEPMKKIRRQNALRYLAVAAMVVCLGGSLAEAFGRHSAFAAGMATGLGVTALLVGGYAIRVGRGTWKPTARTVLAYAELVHRRAEAKARTLRFGFHVLLVTTAAFAGLVAWEWSRFQLREGLILAFLVAELFFLKARERGKRWEIEETKKLVDALN